MKEKENRDLFSSENIISTDIINKLLTIIIKKQENNKYGCLLKFISNKEVLISSFEYIIKNNGYYSQGIDKQILTDVDEKFFNDLSKDLNTGMYKPNPSRRIYINKSDGSKRPLGISCSRDKIVQQACYLTLNYIYDKYFLENSHGFRSNKSCHTAMNYMKLHFSSIKWIINIDIKSCFNNINHNILLNILKNKIDDKAFEILFWKMVKAGYVFNGTHFKTKIGTPQGSILSPILCNIYLNELDIYLTKIKHEFDKGIEKRKNKIYRKLNVIEARKKHIMSRDLMDPNFKRLYFVRYADDFIVGIDGSLYETKIIKEKIELFLKQVLAFDIKRSTIKNFSKEGDHFLGFDIKGWLQISRKIIKTKKGKIKAHHRPKILIPIKKLFEKLVEVGIVKKKNNKFIGTAYRKLIQHPLYNIVEYYNSVYRGIRNYYAIAYNINALRNIHYIIKTSCYLTIALKMKLKTISKVIKKYGKNINIKENNVKINFIKFNNNKIFIKNNNLENPLLNIIKFFTSGLRSKLINNNGCERCGSKEYLSLHHVNPLKNINSKLKTLDKIYIKVHRQQILLCRSCHNLFHKK